MPISKGIPEGKKRFTFTLTTSTMGEMHRYMKQKGANRALLSQMVDDFIADVLKTVKELETAQKRKGSEVTLGDLFTVMGTIMTEKDNNQGKLL